MKYAWRGVLTVVAFAVYGWINYLLNPIATLGAGKIAGKQFENSDVSYVAAQFGMDFFSHLGAPFVVLLGIVAVIWWKPAKAWVLAPTILALAIMQPMPSQAYYDKSDYTEAFFILPSESAFYIPDVGTNKDSQASFGSEKYYRENKIAAKRFVIPHVKLEGSGAWSNFYVPAGRLIIVPRAPYSRQWISAADRGTSSKNEGFKCQSREGLDIGVGISIAASVSEEDSPVFLYNFGTKPPQGDRNDPAVTFTSIFYAKSLTEVMDSVIHASVQGLVCEELTALGLDDNNSKAKETMAKIRVNVEKYLKSVGITLNFIGYADTFEFEKEVQASINRAYIAKNDLAVAQQLAPHANTLQLLANAEAVRTLAGKWNGATPTSVSLWWLPTGISDFVGGLVSPKK